ncbi:MAG TPA: tetratricopeptide repeat protein [Allosphingosinicella sp.]|nr:tetratricopeptide repeat protein [Allosphingosinicella sp.]
MGGWLAMILLALALAAALFPFARRDLGALQFLAAALLLALAGYAWQGRPGEPGRPKQAERAVSDLPDDDFAVLRPELLGRFDRASYWMTLADADRRRGNPHGAAEILQSAIRGNPRSFALWLAYGYSLVAGSDDAMSPAAQLAFERAAQLAPTHPGPHFFYGLALARGGNYQGAYQIWQGLLPNVPQTSAYHAVITERLAAVREAAETGAPLRPATPPPPRPQNPPPVTPVRVVE